MFKGANRYQKVVGQNGAGQGISWFIRQLLPRTYFLKVIFALNRGFLPLIFGAGLKSGSAYALVDLVSLAPLDMPIIFFISKFRNSCLIKISRDLA